MGAMLAFATRPRPLRHWRAYANPRHGGGGSAVRRLAGLAPDHGLGAPRLRQSGSAHPSPPSQRSRESVPECRSCVEACDCSWPRPRALKGRARDPIRAEVLGLLDGEKLGQVRPTTMHPALDRSHGDTADLGGLLIRQALRRNQDQRFPVLIRELGQRSTQVLNVTPPVLLRGCQAMSRIGAVRVCNLVWLLSASGVVGLSHATRPATRALSRALPRRRALC